MSKKRNELVKQIGDNFCKISFCPAVLVYMWKLGQKRLKQGKGF